MIEVKKGPEPEGLKALREECKEAGLSPKESFGMLRKPLKQQVIESLKRDQGLDYQNLFAVCHGNTKFHKSGECRTNKTEDLTCDKHRGNTEFRKINPCCGETLETIFYTLNGEIKATDPDVEFDLVNTLNLNCVSSPIVSERKAALNELIKDMGNVGEDDLHRYCVDMLEAFKNERDPRTPYVGILTWYLRSTAEAIAKATKQEI